MDELHIDLRNAKVRVEKDGQSTEYPMDTAEAFNAVSEAWVRTGWDTKYVYSFSWLGRPIIQLPDDLIRLQEVIYQIKPDVIIETGIAHGGSLVFFASLCKMIGKGRVIGVDIEIRPHNKAALEQHELKSLYTTIEGSSIDEGIVQQVKDQVKANETVLVFLDSNHTKAHVLRELELYSEMVSVGSYIVATDGIMGKVVGAPRTQEDWTWNNPEEAAHEFVASHPNFVIEAPVFPFNEGVVKDCVTYWPDAWIKRVS